MIELGATEAASGRWRADLRCPNEPVARLDDRVRATRLTDMSDSSDRTSFMRVR